VTNEEKIRDAVTKIRELRQVAKEACISTSRSQSLVLRSLPDELLIAVSVELQNDRTGADLNGTPRNPRQQ
jgi:hypothetical protein